MWLRQDFGEFCAKLGGLSYLEMIRAVEEAGSAADRASVANTRGAAKA
jgi:hypothetical protein